MVPLFETLLEINATAPPAKALIIPLFVIFPATPFFQIHNYCLKNLHPVFEVN